MIPGQRRQDSLLDAAGVLIFVDENMVEPAGLGQPHLLVIREEFLHHEQQVVEVDHSGRPQGMLVAAVAGGRQCPRIRGVGGNRVERPIRAHGRALPAADPVDEVAGPQHRLGNLQFLEHLAGDRFLLTAVDDRKAHGIAENRCMPPQHPGAERVDRGDLRLFSGVLAEHLAGAGEHLPCGLVGERDGQDPRWPRPLPHQVGDAGDHHAGLPGAGAGQHEERPDRGMHGLRLRWVQVHRIFHSRPGTGKCTTEAGTRSP